MEAEKEARSVIGEVNDYFLPHFLVFLSFIGTYLLCIVLCFRHHGL